MRIFRAITIILFCVLAAPVLADTAVDKAAFKAAYGRYTAAIEAGNAGAAATAAGEALELGEGIYDADSSSLTALYLNHGYALLDAGQDRAAIKALNASFDRLESLFGDVDYQLAEPLWALLEAYGSNKKRRKTKQVARRISLVIGYWQPSDPVALGDANKKIGIQLQRNRDFELAKAHLEVARQIFASKIEGPSVHMGEALFWLGRIAVRRDSRSKLAAKYFRDALQNFEGLLPDDHAYILTAQGYIYFLDPSDGDCSQTKPEPNICQKFSTREGDYLPIMRMLPVYPEEALRRGLIGWVMLEFTVTRKGVVADPRVIASGGAKVFDRVSLHALKLYKYRPRLENGTRVDTHGVRTVMTFRGSR